MGMIILGFRSKDLGKEEEGTILRMSSDEFVLFLASCTNNEWASRKTGCHSLPRSFLLSLIHHIIYSSGYDGSHEELDSSASEAEDEHLLSSSEQEEEKINSIDLLGDNRSKSIYSTHTSS